MMTLDEKARLARAEDHLSILMEAVRRLPPAVPELALIEVHALDLANVKLAAELIRREQSHGQ